MSLVLLEDRPQALREEWVRPFPSDWLRRLREISPVSDQMDYLVPRWREDEQCWLLYAAFPKHLVSKDRAEQFQVHWSSMPKTEQQGRRRFVTEYQYHMWHVHNVEVKPFWCLQGSEVIVGGTPAAYPGWEKAILVAEGLEAEVVPWGALNNILFDERVVEAIQRRDRLIRSGNNFDRLLQSQRPAGITAEDKADAELLRKAVLQWHHEVNAPCREFIGWYRHQEEYKDTLEKIPAPEGLANTLSDWRDTYVETGVLPQAGHVGNRVVQVPVR